MTEPDSNRPVTVSCEPVGSDLLFLRLRGTEELGRLSKYRIDMLSKRNDLHPSKLLGQDMSVVISLPASDGKREINGIVTAFRIVAPGDGTVNRMARYEAVIRPRLWLLTRASHSRFFHEKTVTEIITKVLQDHHVDLSNKCVATYPKLQHCVQYRETDFAFVSRLMEHEGIYYYFEHRGGKHTLVLTDSGHVHAPIEHYATIPYDAWFELGHQKECVYAWAFGAELQIERYEVNDYDFEKPSSSNNNGLLSRATRPGVYDSVVYTMQEHLSGHVRSSDGDRYARVGFEIRQARNDSIAGRSTARGIWPGGLFKLQDDTKLKDDTSNAQNHDYLVVSANYEINSAEYVSTSGNGGELPFFDCSFTALPKENHFRAERLTPRPVVAGPQTAVVVGPDGDEVLTDKYGRIKVQFHWEQFAPPSDTNSRLARCWVRVSQGWAGKRWGMFVLPRIGQEVIVECLEGDPDRPLVTGCVYNANTMPPYDLPANAALSTLKSNSTKGGGGFNEIRFDDTKGSEQFFIHAENDHETWIKHDTLTNIANDRHVKITGNDFLSVQGAQHMAVTGDRNEKVSGNASLSVGSNLQEKIGSNYAIDASTNIHIKAGENIVIEAGKSITLKVHGAFVVVGPSSVAVSGAPILLNSGGEAGAGSGSSPTEPTAPKDADDGTKKLKS
ncbi:type VI secretion system Vgr family protein [Burkholderia ubonensis]|uniref:type VI secretion system Vgr family protein n=1 Tax=Burkholderia ubonensis TaxID=101571 RepID=UPI000756243C|nr:type VI secretion system tip protein TssI/VgrG [Burkholderia ubonensis]KVQ17131.1 type VI secretion protein Vgr [Burkholderia ubonensis]